MRGACRAVSGECDKWRFSFAVENDRRVGVKDQYGSISEFREIMNGAWAMVGILAVSRFEISVRSWILHSCFFVPKQGLAVIHSEVTAEVAYGKKG